jgi:glutamate carboxypeptidase
VTDGDALLDEMLADLRGLVSVESPSGDVDALRRSAEAVAALIERRLGVRPTLVDGPAGPHVHWCGGGGPKVVVIGHHDTVFPAGTLAARPFTVAGDRATGPGVFDMKAGIVQAVHAVASLADRRGIELLLTADEETGSGTSRELVVERATAAGAALVLEPSAPGGALKIARKGTGTFEVIVTGRASHAGLEPERGINSLVAAAELITHIATLGRADEGTTVTPTMADAGTADNVVPAQTRVKVDVRVEGAAEQTRVTEAMRSMRTSVAGATIEVRGGIGRPPMPAAASATLLPIAVQAARALGLPPVEGVAVGGGSDGNLTAAAGVPTLDGLGAVGANAHGDDEYVEIDTLVPRARLLAAIIERVVSR